jgi:hypothetical protein
MRAKAISSLINLDRTPAGEYFLAPGAVVDFVLNSRAVLHRLACQKCGQARRLVGRETGDLTDHELWTYECIRCQHIEYETIQTSGLRATNR